MTKTSIASEVHQSFNVELDDISKLTFDLIVDFNVVANLANFTFVELFNATIWV
jgi:hypothetical protein